MSVSLRAKRVLAVLMSAVLLYGGLPVSPTVAVAEQAQASDVATPQPGAPGSDEAAETDGIIVTVGGSPSDGTGLLSLDAEKAKDSAEARGCRHERDSDAYGQRGQQRDGCTPCGGPKRRGRTRGCQERGWRHLRPAQLRIRARG